MLRLAIEFSDDIWIELTEKPAAGQPIKRIRTNTLGEAQKITATSHESVFVDVRTHLADTSAAAFAEFERLHPQWKPGKRTGEITHPGTGRSLAGLIWDIWAARVADGVTLRSDVPAVLLWQVIDTVLPELEARGIRFRVGAEGAALAAA
jgi:hypothetical protein